MKVVICACHEARKMLETDSHLSADTINPLFFLEGCYVYLPRAFRFDEQDVRNVLEGSRL